MSAGLVLAVAFGGSLITYILGKVSSRIRDVFAVLVSLALVAMIALLLAGDGGNSSYFDFLGLSLLLRTNMLSLFFAITISVLGALSIIFSLSYIRNRERTDFYYLMLLLINAAMLGIVLSGDLLSFFIFWEIMSWSTFLLISYNRGAALAAGMKYIVMSIFGSLAMLVGVISIYTKFGTLNISEIAAVIEQAGSGYVVSLLILFFTAFGIKNAILPFHSWLPPAHAEAPSPFSSILSGILIKMGTYGFILFMYVIVGVNRFIDIGHGVLSFRYILSILGAITILIPTFIALLQDDAKKLLAWSTIGQAGYIILGIAFGTSVSVAGGMFHFFNHSVFKGLLFLAVGAVEYRTNGVRDLNSLGGLIKKMPVTFTGALIGACGLIGLPLTNGFVSKWLIYKTLILEQSPFLAFAALFGTWGTILYSYKLIHNVFLGQLPERYADIRKSPLSMQLPIITLSSIIILFGIFPGVPLKIINSIGVSLGFDALDVSLWGIASESGTLNVINLFAAIIIGAVLAGIVLKAAPKSVTVSQEDTYAAGAAIPKDRYNYTMNFYNPVSRMISPYLKDFIDAFYMKLAGWTQGVCSGARRIYTGYVGHYVMYIVLLLAVLIFVQLRWSPW